MSTKSTPNYKKKSKRTNGPAAFEAPTYFAMPLVLLLLGQCKQQHCGTDLEREMFIGGLRLLRRLMEEGGREGSRKEEVVEEKKEERGKQEERNGGVGGA